MIGTRHRGGLRGATVGVALVLGIFTPAAQGATGTHVLDGRMSQGDASHPGNNSANASSLGISRDGQVVAFLSAEALVAGDTDGSSDLFVRDGASLIELTSGTQPSAATDVHVLPNGDVLFDTDDAIGPDTDGGFDDYFLYEPGSGLHEISGADNDRQRHERCSDFR